MYLTLRSRPASGTKAGKTPRIRIAPVVFMLGAVSLVTDISSESANAVLPNYLIIVIGLSPQAFGVVNGLYNGVSALVRILSGLLSDRVDRPKWIAFAGYAISALSRLALLGASSFSAFSAVAVTDQIGKGIRTAPRDGMISAASAPESLSRSFGVHRSMDTIGAFIGPLLAFWILTTATGAQGFHSVFVIASAFAVVGVAILVLVVPDLRPRRQRRSSDKPGARAEPGRVTLRHVANPRMAYLLSATGLLGLVTVGETYVLFELQDRDNLALRYFPLMIVGMNLVYLLLAIPIGLLADRVGRWRVFIGGYVALLLAYLFAAGPLSGAPITLGCLALLGAFYASTDGVLAAMAGRAVVTSVRTSGIATAQTVQALAAFAASLGFAELWSTMGRDTALLLVAGLLAVCLPVGGLLLRRVEVASDSAPS